MNPQPSDLISVRILGILSFCFFASISACKKDDQQQPSPTISTISPSSGPSATVVTIVGTAFSSSISGNDVKFNGVDAVVQQASATQLSVIVPKAAGTGPITVEASGREGTGPVFTYINTFTVTTIAGSATAGFADGNGSAAEFNGSYGVATDAQGNIYVADYGNTRIREVTASGAVSTLAGSGAAGFADGIGSAAQFHSPAGIATDAQGNLYISDDLNNRIREINSSANVITIAGRGTAGLVDGNGVAAQFNDPVGVAVDAQGNVFVADFLNNCIRKITSAGVVSTVAGNATAGYMDGTGTAAQFNGPVGIATDAQGNIYVADILNNRIRKITSAGIVTTLAGAGTQGFSDGNGSTAQFNLPAGLAVDASGNVYVADGGNNCIREISPAGVVTTVAGRLTPGFEDGNGSSAQFQAMTGLALDKHGNMYVADGNRIRMINIQ